MGKVSYGEGKVQYEGKFSTREGKVHYLGSYIYVLLLRYNSIVSGLLKAKGGVGVRKVRKASHSFRSNNVSEKGPTRLLT